MNLLFTSWIDIHWTSWTYFINCFQAWEMLGDVIPCFEIINMLMHKGSINIGPHLWLSHGQDKFSLYLINNYKLKKPCYKPWNIHLVYKVVRGTLGCINFKPSLFIFYATIYPWHNNEHEMVFVKSQIVFKKWPSCLFACWQQCCPFLVSWLVLVLVFKTQIGNYWKFTNCFKNWYGDS